MSIKTINPATEEIIAEYQNITEADLTSKVAKSREAFSKWKTDIKNRSVFLHLMAENLRKDKESLAKVATKEMGKPLKESLAEVEKCAWAMEFYGDNGETFLNPEIINTDARKSFVAFDPIGVIASIMPWNFPDWQAFRFAAPSLMAGNTIVLKPVSVTMQCGIEMEKLLVEEKNKEILDSIHYSKRIQNALLPSEKYIERNLNRLKKK